MNDTWRSELERQILASLEALAESPGPGSLERAMAAVKATTQRAGLLARLMAMSGDVPWSRVGAMTAVGGATLVMGVVIGTSGLIPSVGDHSQAPSSSMYGPPASSLPAGGIPAERAIEIAREHVVPDAVFVSVTAGPYSEIHPFIERVGALDFPRDRLIWGVVFESQFEICPPNGSPCFSPRPGWTTVMLDYFTGELLGSAAYSPP